MKKTVTDKQWEQWGKMNPFLGVLGIESAKMGERQIEEAFFASGESHISGIFELISTRFPGFSKFDTALDFGCGVGRLIPPLMRRFQYVTGVDISVSMIELAKSRVDQSQRVDFYRQVAEIDPKKRYDFVHSYIVLQHIRPNQGYEIISNLLDKVVPGGIFALHLTVGDLRSTRRRLNVLRYRIPALHWIYNLARSRPWNEPVTEMNRYDFSRLMQLMRGTYEGGLVVRDFDQNGHVGVMIIGRKK